MLVGVDVGGTFTDFVGAVRGQVVTHKVPSTPADPGIAVLDGLQRLGSTEMAHGTTVATNAILERRGARTALITTAGFEDLLEIGRQNRPSLYDFRATRPAPCVPRSACFGIAERVDSGGRILKGLSKRDLGRLRRRLLRDGIESVAVCLLFSFLNPRHERAIREAFSGLDISLSSEVLPEFREYERASTTSLDAYVKPLVRRYLERLRAELGEEFYVMRSGGGVATSAEVLRRPVEMALSGPAGGVAASATVARLLGERNVVTFDMGGTSADFSALLDFRPAWTNEAAIDGLPLALPVVDITSVGAGGGSLARLDAGRALQVGPQSAGAVPGPLCYGRGGTEPTVADADLLAAYLPDALLGGAMPLRRDLAAKGFTDLAGEMHLSLDETVLDVQRVVRATMTKAMRLVFAKRGLDPRDFALLAYGGAGPMHACALARDLGIPRVIIPFLPGAFSAFGILTSEVRVERSRTIARPLARARRAIDSTTREFRAAATEALRRQELDPRHALFEVSVDLRFAGQSYEINVPVQPRLEEAFRAAHRRLYGYAPAREPIEIVNVRLVATQRRCKVLMRHPTSGALSPSSRRVLFDDGWHDASVWSRPDLPVGFAGQGPTIVQEDHATTVLPPAARFEVRRNGILVVELETGVPRIGEG